MALWLGVPVVAAALLVVGMAAVSRHYRTPRVPRRRDPDAEDIGFEEVRFPTAGGKQLYGWWIPAEGRESAPTLVLVHGEDDAVVPVDHGRRLAGGTGANVELLVLADRGHSDCNRDPLFWPRVTAVLERAIG